MTHRFAPFAFCLVALAAAVAAADPPSPSTDIQPADVAQLVEQLESREFAERQEATRQLSEAGKAAFAELEKASVAGSRETSGRALDVLKGHFQRGDNDTKSAAKATLERLATSGNSAIAQRAQTILNPPPQPNAADLANVFGAAPAIRIAPLQLQIAGGIQAGAIAPGGRSTSVSRSANGDIRILIRENGKTTQIQSTQGKITAEITETQNGKAVTKSIEAKDLAELKKKDADIARLYEQYSQPGGVRVVAQAAAPVAPRTADALKRSIENYDRQIEQLKPQVQNNPTAQRLIDSLQTRKQTYQKQLDELNKAAPAPAPEKPAAPAESKAIGGQ